MNEYLYDSLCVYLGWRFLFGGLWETSFERAIGGPIHVVDIAYCCTAFNLVFRGHWLLSTMYLRLHCYKLPFFGYLKVYELLYDCSWVTIV